MLECVDSCRTRLMYRPFVAIIIPERVDLLAMASFVAGRPPRATQLSCHAADMEHLLEGPIVLPGVKTLADYSRLLPDHFGMNSDRSPWPSPAQPVADLPSDVNRMLAQ